MPAGSDIHVPEHRSNRAVQSCLAIHSPQDRGKLAHSSSLGIYSPVKEGKRAVPSNPEIYSPAVGSLGIHRLDIRKQDICNMKLPRFRGVELDVGDYGSVVTASIAAS